VLWLLIMDSGIHPTIAGVLLAFTFPAKTNLEKSEFKESMDEAIEHFSLEGDDTQSLTERQQESLNVMEGLIQDASMPLERVENFLVGWVSYLIVPIFALCNAGVSLSGGMEFGSPVSIGILLGLVLGKPIGIVLFSLLAIKMKLCAPMLGVNTKQLIATGCIAGIGFTMSLFVAELAFGTSAMLDQAKIAIISASVLSACIGVVFFMMTKPSPTQAES
jgi:NhaA family Na+:H+ antiporter